MPYIKTPKEQNKQKQEVKLDLDPGLKKKKAVK